MASTTAETAGNGGTNGDTAKAPFDFGPNVHVSSHPVISHKLSILRSSSTNAGSFRAALREITFHLAYEATAQLTTRPVKLTVPVGHDHIECTGSKIVERVALVPKLRSGLGMVGAMEELLPKAEVHHIGMYRANQVPVQYYNRLPKKCKADVAFILDVCIATAATVMSLVGILKKWGVPKIHVVAVIGAREGIQKLIENHPDIYITVGCVDDDMTEDGTVLPGLGDAGDRLFGTDMIEDEEELLHVSKRKRSDA